jgi:hypothetical protein
VSAHQNSGVLAECIELERFPLVDEVDKLVGKWFTCCCESLFVDCALYQRRCVRNSREVEGVKRFFPVHAGAVLVKRYCITFLHTGQCMTWGFASRTLGCRRSLTCYAAGRGGSTAAHGYLWFLSVSQASVVCQREPGHGERRAWAAALLERLHWQL